MIDLQFRYPDGAMAHARIQAESRDDVEERMVEGLQAGAGFVVRGNDDRCQIINLSNVVGINIGATPGPQIS